jgi:hypothetical protein
VISRTWPATDQRPVIGGDLVEALTALKNEDGYCHLVGVRTDNTGSAGQRSWPG